MRISDNSKGGVTELVILCLLQEKDMYGYELFQEMKARSDQKFTLIETPLYVPFCLLLLAPGDHDHILSGVFNQFLSANPRASRINKKSANNPALID